MPGAGSALHTDHLQSPRTQAVSYHCSHPADEGSLDHRVTAQASKITRWKKAGVRAQPKHPFQDGNLPTTVSLPHGGPRAEATQPKKRPEKCPWFLIHSHQKPEPGAGKLLRGGAPRREKAAPPREAHLSEEPASLHECPFPALLL